MVLSLHIISRCNYGLCNCSAKVHSRGFQRLVQFAKLDTQITSISSNGEHNNKIVEYCLIAKSAFLIFSFFIVGFLFSLIICHFPTPHECTVFSTFPYERNHKKFIFHENYFAIYAHRTDPLFSFIFPSIKSKNIITLRTKFFSKQIVHFNIILYAKISQ